MGNGSLKVKFAVGSGRANVSDRAIGSDGGAGGGSRRASSSDYGNNRGVTDSERYLTDLGREQVQIWS